MTYKQSPASSRPSMEPGTSLLVPAGLEGLCHACACPVAVVCLADGLLLEANRSFREALAIPEPLPVGLSIAALGGPDLARLLRAGKGPGPRVLRRISLGSLEGRARVYPIPSTSPAQAFLEIVPSAPGSGGSEHEFASLLDERLRQIRNFERLRSLGENAAVIVHEIRSPLSSLKLGLEMIRNSSRLDPSLRPKADFLLDQLDRTDRLLDSIRDFASARPLGQCAVVLGELLRGAISAVEASREGPPTQALIEVRPADLRIWGDPERLGEALQNLIVNAVEAVPGGGTIRLEARPSLRRAGWVDLRVKDRGPGIPPELLGRVFQPFFTTKRTGTGLGLAIVRKIVELHGGFASIESTSADGTSVLLELPLKLGEGKKPGAGKRKADPPCKS